MQCTPFLVAKEEIRAQYPSQTYLQHLFASKALYSFLWRFFGHPEVELHISTCSLCRPTPFSKLSAAQSGMLCIHWLSIYLDSLYTPHNYRKE